MRRPISDQVVAVTGASSGVGRAIARAFGAAGAKVGLIARGMDGLDACAAEIRQAGGEALILPADVAVENEVQRAARTLVDRWGRIDTWVNDAMVSVLSPAVEMTSEEFARVMAVNWLGTVHGTLAALQLMRKANEGVILQIGSALAYRSIPLQSAYCSSKAAIRAFTDSLRSELLHEKSRVRLCMLQLPAVNTPQFEVMRTRLPRHPRPVPPVFQPETVARAALHASLHPAREIWVGWSAAKAIVGQRFIARLLDRYLAITGYRAQQGEQPVPLHRPDNLWAPVPGDRGARGDFSAEAKPTSFELFLRLHRGAVALAAAGLLAGASLIRARA
jgi:short-subunit dehydrogenase